MLISFTRIMGGSLAMQSQRYARNGSGDHTKRADNCVNAERQYERNYEKKAKERQEVRRKGYWRLSVLEPLEWDNAFPQRSNLKFSDLLEALIGRIPAR